MRIAVAGFHIESSSYSPALTRAADFTILRGAALLQAPAFRFLADFDAEFLPVFHARAVPGAPIAAGDYQAFRDEVTRGIAALDGLDGVYLAMHGAAFVEGMEDAEGDFITAVRSIVGEAVPIGVSADLHGNVSQRIVDAIDTFAAYRTAPHVDVEAAQARAVAQLVRRIGEGPGAGVCWCPVPVVLPGERTSTEDEPARSIYAGLPALDARPGIWSAEMMVGYVWADEPRVTAAAVVTGTDRHRMEATAAELAGHYWQARERFAFGTTTASLAECLKRAMASRTRPVVLADSGDNPTAGGAGDRADTLAALLAAGAEDVILAAIADRPATEAAFGAGEGAELTLPIGGTIDPASRPVSIRCRVTRLVDGPGPDRLPDRIAVLETGGVRLVVTARRRPFHRIADFTALGLDPRTARIVVVKSGYLSPELAPIANPSLMALTPGIVDQDIERLPRTRTPRPTYPFDRDFAWTPAPRCSARHGR